MAEVKDGSVEVHLSGHVPFLGEAERYSMRMLWLLPLAVVLIALVHFEAFRSWQGMVLPLVTAILALFWVLGLFGAVGMPFDVFNGNGQSGLLRPRVEYQIDDHNSVIIGGDRFFGDKDFRY